MAGEPLDVFISYSHQDEALKNELVRHLKILQRGGKINTWQDRDIEAGTEWATAIKTQLKQAKIILLLVSSNFLASDYCYETEMRRAVKRHHEGTARVIPIILKPCGWQYTEFKSLQALPQEGQPITAWPDREAALFNVEDGLRKVIDTLHAEQRQHEEVAANRLRQQQAEQERIRQQKQETARREQEHQQQIEAERQRRQQQQAEAARQEQQRRAAEAESKRQRQQQAEEAARRRAEAKQRRSTHQPNISRRRVLQMAGIGSGSLATVLGLNALRSTPEGKDQSSNADNAESPSVSTVDASDTTWPEPPTVSGDSPDNLSAVEVQMVTVDGTGTIIDRPLTQVSAFRQDLGNGVGIDMVSIPAGEFVMGSPDDEVGRDSSEDPQHPVSVPGFLMGRFPITQAQYQAVMNANPAYLQENGSDRPVEQVSWNNAVAFCEKLSQQAGRRYRLPSEGEWEYACRAGTTTPFHFGQTATPDLANYNGNHIYGDGPRGVYRRETTRVGSFPPNAFGLYDMHGNVWEWCQDVWHGSYEGAPADGSAWMVGGEPDWRVRRGGSWRSNPQNCRSAYRLDYGAGLRNIVLGFRVVCSPERTS